MVINRVRVLGSGPHTSTQIFWEYPSPGCHPWFVRAVGCVLLPAKRSSGHLEERAGWLCRLFLRLLLLLVFLKLSPLIIKTKNCLNCFRDFPRLRNFFKNNVLTSFTDFLQVVIKMLSKWQIVSFMFSLVTKHNES